MDKKIAKNCGDYSIGLDIGTNSIGWAVINKEYNIMKLLGKDVYGAYLFEPASDASARRTFRSSRKHYERRRERIRLLQELMNDDVLAKDDAFYIRLKESFLLNRDIDAECGRNNLHNLFDDSGYTDSEYYKQYPTIYHLRYALMNENKKFDARLIYLALHHIVKYRGNFLFEGKDLDFDGGEIPMLIKDYFEELCDKTHANISYCENTHKIYDIVKDKSIIRKDKETAITALFANENKIIKSAVKNFAKLILGYNGNVRECLLIEEDAIEGVDKKEFAISFKDENYEEREEGLLSLLGDKADLLLRIKEIYLNFTFGDILFGADTISGAMISKYEKHAKDLHILKNLYKNYLPDKYDEIFRSNTGNNYVNYAGVKTEKEAVKGKKISQKDFYDRIIKDLTPLAEIEDAAYCLREIINENFIPRINDVANGSMPYQMNEKEMTAIIDNQGKFYENLLKNKDKLLSILTFRRPYYVGTLKGKFSWNNQEIEGKLTPWNFYDKIDVDRLNENFIKKMTNYCLIFKNKKVLPKNSILYQSYIVLNELNKIKIDGKPISLDMKKNVFLNLMCVKKNVSVKNLTDFIKRNYGHEYSAEDISGLNDGKFTSTMGTLIDFKNILKDDFKVSNLEKYESAVRTLTLFEDKKLRLKKLAESGIYNEQQLKSLSALRYKKWGKYSKMLLHGILANGKTILGVMFDDVNNPHINEILFDEKYGFKEQLPKDEEMIEKFDYKTHIEPLYCSPSVKKAIWNTLNIITEIEKITGKAPARIFLESTESTELKKPTKSRVFQLKMLYKSIENEKDYNRDCQNEITKLFDAKKEIPNDKTYLWLLQLGRCMYSGDVISYDDIDKCEIDHIVPRCLIKDDSFENRVLVKRIENQNKKNFALSAEIRNKMRGFWKLLYDKKFIGPKKYNNLLKSEYNDADCAKFINRQLVETSQTVKEVKKLLLKRYPNADIQCVKAGINSQFRNKYMRHDNLSGFYKIRSLNDYHHAKDAYLTAVIGQFTTVACPLWGQNSYNKFLNASIKEAADKKELNELVNKRYGIVLDLMEHGRDELFEVDDDGEYLWNSTYYSNIFENMAKNNALVVKQKQFTAESEFYNQTIYSPRDKIKNLIPLRYINGKPLPTEFYGGYSSVNPAYFAIIKYNKGKKENCEFIQIPTMVAVNENRNPDAVMNYIKSIIVSKADLNSIEIVKKIYKNQLIKIDGQLCRITGEKELNNATQLYVLPKYDKMLYLIEKASDFSNPNRNKYFSALKYESDKYENMIKEFLIYFSNIVRNHCPLFKTIADNMLIVANEKFDDYDLNDKIKYMSLLMKVLSPKASQINMSEFGGSSSAGRLQKSIKPREVEWIDKSCTGLYTKTVKGIDF